MWQRSIVHWGAKIHYRMMIYRKILRTVAAATVAPVTTLLLDAYKGELPSAASEMEETPAEIQASFIPPYAPLKTFAVKPSQISGLVHDVIQPSESAAPHWQVLSLEVTVLLLELVLVVVIPSQTGTCLILEVMRHCLQASLLPEVCCAETEVKRRERTRSRAAFERCIYCCL